MRDSSSRTSSIPVSHPLEPTSVDDVADRSAATSSAATSSAATSSATVSTPILAKIRIGPFDGVLSPTGTPNHGVSEHSNDGHFRTDHEASEVLRALNPALLTALERSGELVDDAFVRRWVDKRSSTLLEDLDAHAAWRTEFVADDSGSGYGIREARISALLDAGVVCFQGNASAGFSGHPLLVFKADRYDASRFSSQLSATLVYAMDAAITCADPEVNKKRQVVWLFDLQNVSRKNCSRSVYGVGGVGGVGGWLPDLYEKVNYKIGELQN